MKKDIFNSGTLSYPIKTGSIGDNLSLSFVLTIKMLARQWHLVLVMSFIAGLITIGVSFLFDRIGAGLPESSTIEKLTGSVITIPAYIVLYIFLLYRFGIMIRESEAFADFRKRGPAPVFGYFILNNILMFLFLIVVSIPFFIIVIIPLVGPFAFMFAIPLYLFIILIFIAVASQPLIYSYFRKIYPIRAWKFSLKGLLKRAGHRRGGIFGLNMWHFIGVCLLASVINITIALIVYVPTIYLSSTILPTDIPYLQHVSTALTVMISMCIYYIIYYFTFTTSAVYISELLAFGENGIREEIISRAD